MFAHAFLYGLGLGVIEFYMRLIWVSRFCIRAGCWDCCKYKPFSPLNFHLGIFVSSMSDLG